MLSPSNSQHTSSQGMQSIIFPPDLSLLHSSPIDHEYHIPLIRNIKDDKNANKRPKVYLPPNERNCCLDTTHKTTNTSLKVKTILGYQVEETKILLEETVSSLDVENSKESGILKRNREDKDENKQPIERHAPVHWNAMYQRLIEYKKKHGNCLVPQQSRTKPEIKSLGKWVGNQRAYYKSFKNGKGSKITPQRIKALNEIDFVWDSYEYRWQLKYDELVTYCAETGNCCVPCKYDANPELGIWCKTQREQWYRLKRGLSNTLSHDRIKALNSIGFVFELKNLNSSIVFDN